GKMIFFSKNEVDQWIFKSSHKAQGTSYEVTECLSARVEKDPNQIEMELNPEDEKRKTEEKDSSATLGMTKETEIVIEFPLKSRRKK
ncbi:MAG: hypothetical protein Q8S01_02985, partial [Ignavibacteria bacterium]|nr:hypothetical protein [Ignavibacteria bacterium]